MAIDGRQLIEWAVSQCAKAGLPPLDANILMYIRLWSGEQV